MELRRPYTWLQTGKFLQVNYQMQVQVLDEEKIVFRKLFAFTRIYLNVICRLILVIGAEGKAVVRNTFGLHTLLCDVSQAPREQHSHCSYFLPFYKIVYLEALALQGINSVQDVFA